MKNITYLFLFILVSFSINAQTYTTGTIQLSNTSGLAMTLRLDIGTQVDMILTGPADRWFSVGFGATSMTTGTDTVLCHTDASLTSFDRVLPGLSAPTTDAIQNWTIVSNTVSGNVRTITATRALNTGDPNDFVFVASPSALSIIWARANTNNYSLVYHGGTNRGATTANLTLGTDDFLLAQFKMFPNPSNDFITVELPDGISTAVISIYDYLGRIIIKESLEVTSSKIVTSNLQKGTYIVKVASDNGIATKILIVD